MRRVLVTCAALACLAAPVFAQNPGRAGSLDVTLGFAKGWGGAYWRRRGVAAELTGVLPHVSSRFLGIGIGGQGSLPPYGDCRIISPELPCLHGFPATLHVALLGGLERANEYDAVRAMIGPAYFGSDGEGFGALARIDVSVGFGHVGLIGALQGALDVRSQQTLRLGTVLFGVRLQ